MLIPLKLAQEGDEIVEVDAGSVRLIRNLETARDTCKVHLAFDTRHHSTPGFFPEMIAFEVLGTAEDVRQWINYHLHPNDCAEAPAPWEGKLEALA